MEISLQITKDGKTLFESSDAGIAPIFTAFGLGVLAGAEVFDRVVGYASAALIAEGGAAAVRAGTMSKRASELLTSRAVPHTYARLADAIKNRDGTDLCPIEKLCGALPPTEVFGVLDGFLQKRK